MVLSICSLYHEQGPRVEDIGSSGYCVSGKGSRVEYGGLIMLIIPFVRFPEYKFLASTLSPKKTKAHVLVLVAPIHMYILMRVSGFILSARWMTMWRVPSRCSDISFLRWRAEAVSA